VLFKPISDYWLAAITKFWAISPKTTCQCKLKCLSIDINFNCLPVAMEIFVSIFLPNANAVLISTIVPSSNQHIILDSVNFQQSNGKHKPPRRLREKPLR